MSHFRTNKHGWVYTLSQPEMRDLLTAHIVLPSEELVKYVYDGYTHMMGMKPIRKPKTRKKVQLEFHRRVQGIETKAFAQEWVNKAVRYTACLN